MGAVSESAQGVLIERDETRDNISVELKLISFTTTLTPPIAGLYMFHIRKYHSPATVSAPDSHFFLLRGGRARASRCSVRCCSHLVHWGSRSPCSVSLAPRLTLHPAAFGGPWACVWNRTSPWCYSLFALDSFVNPFPANQEKISKGGLRLLGRDRG